MLDPSDLTGKVAIVTGANTRPRPGHRRRPRRGRGGHRRSSRAATRAARRRPSRSPAAAALHVHRRSSADRADRAHRRGRSAEARPRSTSWSTTPASSAAPTSSTSPKRTGTTVMDVNLKLRSSAQPGLRAHALVGAEGAAARSSTSPRCCPSRAASACRPTPPRRAASPASRALMANESGGQGHQRQRHRARLHGDRQHRGAPRRRRPQHARSSPASRPAAGARPPTCGGAVGLSRLARVRLRPRPSSAGRWRLAGALTPIPHETLRFAVCSWRRLAAVRSRGRAPHRHRHARPGHRPPGRDDRVPWAASPRLCPAR